MPLKIRCPHCHRTLVADDETVGQGKLCPACGKGFTVPIPVREPAEHADVTTQCPSCGTDLAPGTTLCPRCHYDVPAGHRLPLGRRLQFVSLRTWMILAATLTAIIIAAVTGTNVYHSRKHRSVPPAASSKPTSPTNGAETEWARRLLAATSSAERTRAYNELLRRGTTALPAVAREMEQSRPGGIPAKRNRVAAVELLIRSSDDRWLPLLKKLSADEEIRDVTTRGRGLLGDASAADDLLTLWLVSEQRLMFAKRLSEYAASSVGPAARGYLHRLETETQQYAEALRVLADSTNARVIDRALSAYWDSWRWLGQQRGELMAGDLFELAKPPTRDSLDFKQRVRSARQALDRASQRASPASRAAAGIVLTQCAPQYKSLRGRIMTTLATILPTSAPSDQQRICWTLARLAGRSFAGTSETNSPVDFSRASVRDALKWIRSNGIANPRRLRTPSSAYPVPPMLKRRIVTPRRQMQLELLSEFGAGWSGLAGALDDWLAADLGCTPQIQALLNPANQAPNHSALAAAIVIAARSNANDLKSRLELWQQATDQPAWVRGLAYTALGTLDARSQRWESGWPAKLRPNMLPSASRDGPGWPIWERLLAANASAMLDRLKRAPPDSLSDRLRVRLQRAAERATRDRAP